VTGDEARRDERAEQREDRQDQRADRQEQHADAIADRLTLVAQMLETAVGELNDLMTQIKTQPDGKEPEW